MQICDADVFVLDKRFLVSRENQSSKTILKKLALKMYKFKYLPANFFEKGVNIYVKCNYCTSESNALFLSKLLKISVNKAHHICLKYPVLQKLTSERIKDSVDLTTELGFPKSTLEERPVLFSLVPITLKYRYNVLQECGVQNITTDHIMSYLQIVKQKTIKDLKQSLVLKSHDNIENRLAGYMTQWPTSLTTKISGEIDNMSLYDLRLKIIHRYLELILDLTEEEFYRAIKTYPTIKHRPLQVINETVCLLQSVIMIPSYKIKNNMYLVHADPENLKQIMYKLRSIGGIDAKEVLRARPKLATKRYTSLLEIQHILQEHGISNEAQKKCLDIFTLGPNTVKERLKQANDIPEFTTYSNHPRFLKMIHYKQRVLKRMNDLYSNNKKCASLNVLSGSSAHFDIFKKTPGDRLGKAKDLIFCISQLLDNKYKMNDIRQVLRRHPYWFNIPLLQVKYVYQKLSQKFTNSDIYENCTILLYPWNKINETLIMLHNTGKDKDGQVIQDSLDVTKLQKSQKLSLILYFLEKNHYFTGNGVWTDEKNKVGVNSK